MLALKHILEGRHKDLESPWVAGFVSWLFQLHCRAFLSSLDVSENKEKTSGQLLSSVTGNEQQLTTDADQGFGRNSLPSHRERTTVSNMLSMIKLIV